MKQKRKLLCALLAIFLTVPIYACNEDSALEPSLPNGEQTSPLPEETPEQAPEQGTPEQVPEQTPPEQGSTQSPAPEQAPAPKPQAPKTQNYIRCVGDNVNLRSGAGTSYTVLGQAEKGTMYAVIERTGNWYKVKYKNKTAYLYSEYATMFSIKKSENDKVEKVIEGAYSLIGIPYVYGAVRLHDGKGNLLKGFSMNKFDCSSLVQFSFYEGAKVLLDVTTRTQVVQGKYVPKKELSRGDCIYFTNESRQYKTGIERVGHVAIYLGDDYILHTASDYARIEKMTASRWKFYIETRRFV